MRPNFLPILLGLALAAIALSVGAATIPVSMVREVSARSEMTVMFGDVRIVDEDFIQIFEEGALDDQRASSLTFGHSETESSASQSSFISPTVFNAAGSIQGVSSNDEGLFVCQSSPATEMKYRFEVEEATPFRFSGHLNGTGGGGVVFRLETAFFPRENIFLEFANGEEILVDYTGELAPGTYDLRLSASAYISPGDTHSAEFFVEGSFGAVAAVPDMGSPIKLAQNHPNPFNPSTTFGFDLATPGPVELTIYDVTGRRVRTLVHESRAAGRYEETWGGLDRNGLPVASGVYLYKLKSGPYAETRRMTLMK